MKVDFIKYEIFDAYAACVETTTELKKLTNYLNSTFGADNIEIDNSYVFWVRFKHKEDEAFFIVLSSTGIEIDDIEID